MFLEDAGRRLDQLDGRDGHGMEEGRAADFSMYVSPRTLIDVLTASDYEDRTMGSFVERKMSSVTFHYRNADPVFGLFQGTSIASCATELTQSQPRSVRRCSSRCKSRSRSMCSSYVPPPLSCTTLIRTPGQEKRRGSTSAHQQGRDRPTTALHLPRDRVLHVRRG